MASPIRCAPPVMATMPSARGFGRLLETIEAVDEAEEARESKADGEARKPRSQSQHVVGSSDRRQWKSGDRGTSVQPQPTASVLSRRPKAAKFWRLRGHHRRRYCKMRHGEATPSLASILSHYR